MKSDIAIAEIAQPYAQALMSVAESKNQTEEFGEDVRSLLNLLQNSPELQSFVGNPFIEADKKRQSSTKSLAKALIQTYAIS